MKNRWLIFPSLLSLALAFGTCVSPARAEDEAISVKVRDTRLRAQPKAWAPGTQTLTYGTRLTVLGTQDGWFKVQTTNGKQGFVHPSAVTDKKIVFNSSKSPEAQTDSADVVLAGKGFSKEVESVYAKSNPSLKFGELNQIETLRVSDGELYAFMRQGMLGKEGL